MQTSAVSISSCHRFISRNAVFDILKVRREQMNDSRQWRSISRIAKHKNNKKRVESKTEKSEVESMFDEYLAKESETGKSEVDQMFDEYLSKSADSMKQLKAVRVIQAASRACEGDLQNFELQSTVLSAKALGVSGERIIDAIEYGEESAFLTNRRKRLERSIRFDAVLETPCGKVNFILLTLSNNRDRTERMITSILERYDGRLLPSGFNNRFFVKAGVIHVKTEIPEEYLISDAVKPVFVQLGQHPTDESRAMEKSELEEIIECCIDGGAKDFEFTKDAVIAKCKDTRLEYVVKNIFQYGYKDNIHLMEYQYMAKHIDKAVNITEETMHVLEECLDLLKVERDMIHIYHNAVILAI